jgi:hypothetical protein
MVKFSLLISSAIAFALVLVVIMATGYGALSVFGSTTTMFLTVGTATLVLGLLIRDDCRPGHPCF